MQFLQGFHYGTKLIFWTLFLIQLLLIAVFWILQQNLTEIDINEISNNNGFVEDHDSSFTVHFIKNNDKLLNGNHKQNENVTISTFGLNFPFVGKVVQNEKKKIIKKDTTKKVEVMSFSNFSKDFIIFEKSGENFTENLLCFREGTILNSYEKTIRKCNCKRNWHGLDCGQPEVLWRTFMIAKLQPPPKLQYNEENLINKIFLMLIGTFYNFELLEIQIMELINSVDYFIICRKDLNENYLQKKTNKKSLKLNFASAFHERIIIINDLINCKPKLIYNRLKTIFNMNLLRKRNDIFIYSQDNEILNYKIINYLKYYNIMDYFNLLYFRLKYNVYGFFWQHPNRTCLGSVATTLSNLEENFQSDPEKLLIYNNNNNNNNDNKNTGIIVGDLNHIGGWYCEYCYQPNEIINKLNNNNRNNINEIGNIFPKSIKNHQIDSSYIQNLIASGLYLDGKLNLLKLYRFNERYYTPEYVEKNSWKFDNIITNLYLSFDDDLDYD